MISKKQVETWCEYNNYLLVNLKDNKIPIEKVKKIAEKAVNIYSISNDRHTHRDTFARDLALSYLKDKFPKREILSEFGINDGILRYATSKIKKGNFRYPWNEKAVEFFKEKVEQAEVSLKKL